jgi:hypothetical protein
MQFDQSPPGATPVTFAQPDGHAALYNATILRFSPDGKSILLLLGDKGRTEAWLMPYPPNSSKPPRLVQSDSRLTVARRSFRGC